ncbi:FAD-dependent oxidoreductase, partial [Thermodesulfobacteriota bacterium]
METRVIILGGGISGLSLAWRLSGAGVQVHVLESDNTVGGLAGTQRENGYCLDVGPHSFFSDDTEILEIVLDLFGNRLKSKPRQVKFFYQDRFLDYPLTPYGVLFQMGLWSGIQAGLSFLKSKVMPRKRVYAADEDENVEDWAINSFGKHLAAFRD